jgi:histidine triad (HIT) family protein
MLRRAMAETIFSKILRGEIPCHKLYEDELVLAFLDIAPLANGHALVIPKEPAVTLDQLSDESAAALGRVMPRVCRALMAATGTREYNILQNNGRTAHQAVDHVHFHIIPKPSNAQGLGVEWPAGKLDAEAAKALAESIRQSLAR